LDAGSGPARDNSGQMPERITLRAIHSEFARFGHNGLLAKRDGYFCFRLGDAADWIAGNGAA
jgi:hypothetical protein